MEHLFVVNAPCVIQTIRGRYRSEAAGDILRLSAAEAEQVRAETFPQRNLLTYLGKDQKAGKTIAAVPVKKKAAKTEEEDPK